MSLMLLKPSGAVPHVGGALMKPGEPAYELLRLWIAEGVKLDLGSPRVKSIDVLPKNPTVPLPGMKQQVAVLATYSDGSVRDVTVEAFEKNTPYDKFVHTILTASGSTMTNPPAAYYKVLRNPQDVMENTTQLFLAVRFNCNKCHDHPFERWTQDQYYHLSAYFSQVGRAPDPKFAKQFIPGTDVEAPKPLVEIISDLKSGDVNHERTGRVTPPQFPFTHKDLAPETASRREQLAHWLTSKENPYFAKSYVNRIWSYLLGAGLIEPIDDIRAGNPPSNPKLLDRLTDEFVKGGFNTRELMRTVCKSRVYQLSIA